MAPAAFSASFMSWNGLKGWGQELFGPAPSRVLYMLLGSHSLEVPASAHRTPPAVSVPAMRGTPPLPHRHPASRTQQSWCIVSTWHLSTRTTCS